MWITKKAHYKLMNTEKAGFSLSFILSSFAVVNFFHIFQSFQVLLLATSWLLVLWVCSLYWR